jgi:hypothetical protein
LENFRESDHQVLCFWTEREKAVAGMVPAIEKARLYRGKGGEIMRSAVSRLIEYTALVEIRLSPKIQKILHDSLDENLKHPNAEIQVGSSVLFEL